MARNIVGLYDNSADAQAALQDLRSAGFSQDQISFVANNARGEYDQYASDADGLLTGLSLFAIPGIGPVAGLGGLATLAGADIDTAVGDLLGALVDVGIPEEDANMYTEGVRRGGTLLMISEAADDQVDRSVDILNRHNVVDIDERGAQYRSEGWTRFDENAGPYQGSTATTTGGEDRGGTGRTRTADYDTARTCAGYLPHP